MAKEAARRLKQYVKGVIGDGLRTVVLITQDGLDGIYLRDDLKEEYSEPLYSDTVGMFRTTEETDFLNDISSPLGIRHATVFYPENAFVFRFRYSWDEHILVGIDPETGRELLEFIGDCQTIVQGEEK